MIGDEGVQDVFENLFARRHALAGFYFALSAP